MWFCLSLHPHKGKQGHIQHARPAHSLPPKAGHPVQGWEGRAMCLSTSPTSVGMWIAWVLVKNADFDPVKSVKGRGSAFLTSSPVRQFWSVDLRPPTELFLRQTMWLKVLKKHFRWKFLKLSCAQQKTTQFLMSKRWSQWIYSILLALVSSHQRTLLIGSFMLFWHNSG